MQSGITASRALLDAFNTLTTDSTQRALLAGIENECLVPKTTLPAASPAFQDDLHQLQIHLSPSTATYILLKLDDDNAFAAITYVPNAAPVRQKMLFASTSKTLVKDLGAERFRETLFATEAEELTKEGWARHERHTNLKAPLTEEELGQAGVREAEAQESQGTGARRGHVNSKINVPTGESVLEALSSLNLEGCRGTLVQLKYQLPDETLVLDSSADSIQPSQVASLITPNEPRYSFYSHPTASAGTPKILFIYTCPTSSKIKERMVYSTSKSWTRTVAERDAGIVVSKSLEATEPSEITAEMLGGEDSAAGAESLPSSKGFARPKRPGRR